MPADSRSGGNRPPCWLPALVLALAAACGPPRFPWPRPAGREPVPVGNLEVQTINPGYHRLRSRVLVRRVLRPTRANLDYAAYHANVMINGPEPQQPLPPANSVPATDKLFAGVLVPGSVVASMGQTPLSESERRRPLAFSPLVDFLSRWDYAQAAPLESARSAVRAESWGGPRNIQHTSQEISELYRHQDGDAPAGEQWWVKIEFAPWARLFADMPDEDGDGVPEIYGQLQPRLVSRAIVDRVKREYCGRLLETGQVKAWLNELASYWYPSYNTDVVDLGDSRVWPLADTEPEVVAELAGLQVAAPVFVMRGKPRGRAIYNVFAVAGLSTDGAAPPSPAAAASAPVEKRRITPLLEPRRRALARQLADNGGSWQQWAASLARHWRHLRQVLRSRPESIKALAGRDGFLFFRNSIRYVVGGDLQQQPAGKNPFPTIVDFKNYLERLGVDFLLVPIPTKVEVFPDKILPGRFDPASLPVLNPYGRKLLLELTGAGVEVVDLLPAFLAARASRRPEQQLLYQPQDTHWTDRGLRLAARLLAARIKKYPWHAALAKKTIAYRQEEVRFRHQGDLVSRLAEEEKGRYRPAELIAHRVLDPDGQPYDDDPHSPIVILGDSFTGVYQRTYCRNAGVSAHLARLLGHPVDLVMSYGGGPNVRRKLLRRGEQALAGKRLVIWMFAARDLYDYWEDWEPLKPERKER